MSGIKKHIIKGMHKVMLDCDTATLFVTKREYVDLGCIDKMKLSMHLATCKYCRQFAKQSKDISNQIAQINNTELNNLSHQLSDEQKNNIIKEVEKQNITD